LVCSRKRPVESAQSKAPSRKRQSKSACPTKDANGRLETGDEWSYGK
jgi:hypothetical protein